MTLGTRGGHPLKKSILKRGSVHSFSQDTPGSLEGQPPSLHPSLSKIQEEIYGNIRGYIDLSAGRSLPPNPKPAPEAKVPITLKEWDKYLIAGPKPTGGTN